MMFPSVDKISFSDESGNLIEDMERCPRIKDRGVFERVLGGSECSSYSVAYEKHCVTFTNHPYESIVMPGIFLLAQTSNLLYQ